MSFNVNPFNYARGVVVGLRDAIERGETKVKTALAKDLAAVLPELKAFEPGAEHEDAKAQTIADAEALLKSK